jgi:galactokinase/mevalonate kinase-like predicted kinase
MTQVLLSVPPACSKDFAALTGRERPRWFAAHDPADRKLGSGGGTAHLVHEAWKALAPGSSFADWSAEGKRVILHAGGQSRRLPAYAPAGKALLPVPVFRWMKGQRLDQTLLDLQLPLLEGLLEAAPPGLRWLVGSGDVLVWNEAPLGPLPDVDVLCVGLWDSPEKATGHGCFFASRRDPRKLEAMLQKPSVATIQARMAESFFLLDIGIWLFSDRALRVLFGKAGYRFEKGDPVAPTSPSAYDLYGEFGLALGEHPTVVDPEVNALSCALLDLPRGEFYHFGTNAEIIHSSLALQNRVLDQRRIRSALPKPHPSIFIQNARTACPLEAGNREIWIENCDLGPGWKLSSRHVLTGIPGGAWSCVLPPGTCLDFVPLGPGEDRFAVRFYGYEDAFRGAPGDAGTRWCGVSVGAWAEARGLEPAALGWSTIGDVQQAPLFPVMREDEIDGAFLRWLFVPENGSAAHAARYAALPRLSAEELSARADLARLFATRRARLRASLPLLAAHAERSVFHQIDLDHAAREFAATSAELPGTGPDAGAAGLLPFLHDRMFRACVERRRGGDPAAYESEAFEALRQAVIEPFRGAGRAPRNTFQSDQVIWGRSPVRLDLAGGWSDTPPYCFLAGGNVVNLAVDLNGQPPVQVFARLCAEPHIVLHSIDLGQSVRFETYEDLAHYAGLNSGFAIPRAALALAGFHPRFLERSVHETLAGQLRAFGGGLELSLLCAVPKGSGLGTSSILAATLLGVLSELGNLGWTPAGIGARVLAVEQMLTSGGGWQDQFGGLLRGLKLLQTAPGLAQEPTPRWLPGHLFEAPEHRPRCLLYYTGITRVAHSILGEIVRGMFLNRQETLRRLDAISQHALVTAEAIQADDFEAMAACVARSWELNQALDGGTNPPEVQRMLAPIGDWVAGLKLLGAGGGGYLLILAKDGDAAGRVRRHLEAHPPNPGARFVDPGLSRDGLRITRS